MNNQQSKPPPPSVIRSLICVVGNKDIQTHGVFPVIKDSGGVIDINLNGRKTSIDTDTLSLDTGSEGLVRFGHRIEITCANNIAIHSVGGIDITTAKNIDADKQARVFSIVGAIIKVDDTELTFNAKGYLYGEDDKIQLSQKHTTGFFSDKDKGEVLVGLVDDIALATIKAVLDQNNKNLVALTMERREAIIEAIQKHFPNKNGYLNDSNIKTLAGKIHLSGTLGSLSELGISALINIVVNDYDRYVRLYNSKHGDTSLLAM